MQHTASTRRALPAILLIILAGACRSPILDIAGGAMGRLLVAFPTASSVAGSRAGGAGNLSAVFGTIHSWTLLGAGPKGAKANIDFAASDASSGTVSVELALGDWSLTLKGFDADGVEVLSADSSVTIKSSDTNTCVFTMAWAEKALVARLSFDSAIQDDTGRLIATSTGSPLLTDSSALAPTLDGKRYLAFIGSQSVDLSSIDLGDQLSVSLWMYVSGAGDMVLATSKQNAGDDGFTLYRGGSGTIRVETKDGSNLETGIVAATTGTWYHVAFAMDIQTGRATIFVNGAFQTSAEVITIDTSLPIRLGDSFYEAYDFNGRLDDVRLYSGALSADDVATIYADGYFSGGRGTEASPYIVATPMDLYNVRYFPAAYYRQTADIDLGASAMTSTWTPIATFSGNYDGGGRSVSNVALGTIAGTDAGFFGVIPAGSVVRNLTLNTVTGTSTATRTGSLAGSITGATISDITITGIDLTGTSNIGGLTGVCTNSVLTGIRVSGEITTSLASAQYIGGMAGTMVGTIQNCIADISISPTTGTVFSNANHFGGFAGTITGATTVTNCQARGAITYNDATTSGLFLGGFAGTIEPGSAVILKLEGCDSSGSILCDRVNQVGGFAGQLYSGSGTIDIEDCASTGAVTARNGDYIGGFAGYGSIHTSGSGLVQIRTSSSNGMITANGTSSGSFVGGFIGYAKEGSDIEACFSDSDVIARSQFIGGFVGALGSNATAAGACGSIRQCYATGTVTGSDTLGGFAGGVYQASTIENCYTRSSVQPAYSSNNGGFIGLVDNSTYGNPIIRYCYSAGTANSAVNYSFIGTASGAITVTACRCDTEVSGKPHDDTNVTGAWGLTTDEMWSPDNFINYGWGSAWSIVQGSYPTLAWEHE